MELDSGQASTSGLTGRPTEHTNASDTATALDLLTTYSLHTIFSDEARAREVCSALGMMPTRRVTPPPPCPKCHGPMCEKPGKVNQMGYIYRCRRSGRQKPAKSQRKSARAPCNGSVSPLRNTFFEGVHISVLKVIHLMHAWVLRTPVTTAAIEAEVAPRTAVDFYSFFREVALVHVSHMQMRIGGPGKTVEVDEMFARRRKYHRGRVTASHTITIFGIYCRETRVGLYWHVPNKTRAVLWGHMYTFIEAGSTVVSDSAPQYAGCEQLGFAEHKTVNHSVRGPGRFVSTTDPAAHTQNIETRHRHLKDTIKTAKDDATMGQYIAEYTYRERRFRGLVRSGQKLRIFIEDVVAVYPDPGRRGLELQTIGVEDATLADGPYVSVNHCHDTQPSSQEITEEESCSTSQ